MIRTPGHLSRALGLWWLVPGPAGREPQVPWSLGKHAKPPHSGDREAAPATLPIMTLGRTGAQGAEARRGPPAVWGAVGSYSHDVSLVWQGQGGIQRVEVSDRQRGVLAVM